MKRRILVLASMALLGLTNRASAQEPAYVEELRFVEVLRQRGDTDLARERLDLLEKSGSAQLRSEIPFEKALCNKAEALHETDSNKRLRLYTAARAELI